MNSHTLEITTLHALNGDSVSITSASRTADTAALSFRLDSVDDSAPWAFGDEVTLTENGEPIFHGYVTEEPETIIDAGGLSCNVKLGNIVALMDATPFIGDQGFGSFLYALGANDGRFVSSNQIIEHVLSNGMVLPGGEPAASEHFDISIDSTIKCPVGSGSQSCWSLIDSCLHWVPDAVTWYNPKTQILSLRSATGGNELTLDLAAGEARQGDEILFTFAGYEAASFRPRHDLCPPVVGLTWEGTKQSKIFPEDGNLRQPWAFHFQIANQAGAGIGDELPPAEARRAQRSTQPTMTVLGRKVPTGWSNEGDMKSPAAGAPGLWHNFWKSWPEMRPLAKTNVACLQYGQAIFEPLSVDEAYPDEETTEEETDKPENYEAFTPADVSPDIYALVQGSFPASSKKRDNVSGLTFCKGKLKQYVWFISDYQGELSEEEWKEFFSGSNYVQIGNTRAKTRYAVLELDGIFINRRRKKYQTGTNKLDPTDPDYSAEEEEEEGGNNENEITNSFYSKATEDYYNATRKLFYDGSISLRGVSGYNPAQLDGANLNITGSRTEWENMATPVVQAEYNPQFHTLTISTGSPEILTIDERVQRMLIGRQTNSGAGTSLANPPRDMESEEEEETESNDYPMISPSISASATAIKSGKPLNPLEFYSEGKGDSAKWFINEGVLFAPGGKIINFETTEITELVAQYPNDKFTVRAERKPGTNEWEAVIRHYTPKKTDS